MPQTFNPYAWLPDQKTAEAEDYGIQLAIDWIRKVGVGRPVLLTNTLSQRLQPELEQPFKGRRISPQGRSSLRGPVLAFKPSEATLALAQDASRGDALFVVEGFYTVSDWAAGVGAIDILTGEVLGEALDSESREALESAILFGGNNAWSGSHERSHAARHLNEVVRDGRVTADSAAAYVLSKGRSGRAAKGIRKVVESMR